MRLFFIPFYILSLGVGVASAADEGVSGGLPVWGSFSGDKRKGGEELCL